MATETGTGIHHARVTAWLAEHLPQVTPPFQFRLIAGGRSNLTYEVVDADGSRLVLRRPPLGNVLPSAHDMAREHRIISALGGTPIPVATPLGLCVDTAVTGAPFYVMTYVEGNVVRTAEDCAPRYDEAGRARFARSFVDTLADLHAIDAARVGLDTLGRGAGYVERQLRRWRAQLERSTPQEVPSLAEAHRRLSARVPPQRRTTIVHGDYRTENCIVAADGSIAAILDWELCTIGDPLADLAWLLAHWFEPGEAPEELMVRTPTTLPGFPTRDEVAARYAARTGADLGDLAYFMALTYWKLGCVAAGVHARYRAGVMGDAGSPEAYADLPAAFGERALAILDDLD
jgi:aminoglycoside phosphotransferase (APT) family kinase protein